MWAFDLEQACIERRSPPALKSELLWTFTWALKKEKKTPQENVHKIIDFFWKTADESP